MELKQDATIMDILSAAEQEKQDVNVILSSGQNFKGSVVQVGSFHVRVQLKDDRSFFDVMIKLEHISAIEMQIRT